MKIYIGKKLIGEYDEATKTFRKEVVKDRHLFRVLDAWGVDNKRVIARLPEETQIVVDDLQEGIRYTSDIKTFKEKGKFYHFKGQKDHEVQMFLPRSIFVQAKI